MNDVILNSEILRITQNDDKRIRVQNKQFNKTA